MGNKHPCGKNKEIDLERRVKKLQEELLGELAQGEELTGKENINEVFMHGFPAFGGKLVREAYRLMRNAIINNYTIFASFAGPITASDYSRVWVIPFIKAGYISAFTASDAISYHDAHDAVEGKREIHDVDMYRDDEQFKDAGIIRITDIGFPEEVLLNTDTFMAHILSKPEFQKKLTTTQYRWLLGKYLHALEEKKDISHGLLATAFEYDVPAFCPSPADGSTFLNAMKLWALQERLGKKLKTKQNLQIDLQKDVYEFCALHYWAQHNEGNKELAYFAFGGGAVKNYLLQPEPALEQILFIPTKKYQIGVQFTTAPVTDGSLSSCWPSEAISWGKLQKEALTVSVPIDYTMIMSLIAHTILKERWIYQDKLQTKYNNDKDTFFSHYQNARGFLREPQRLYKKRGQAMEFLDKAAEKHSEEMLKSLIFKE